MNLSDVEKAAVLLMALGPERSERILDQLSSEDLLPIVAAMKRMRSIPRDVRRAVLVEVNRILAQLMGDSAQERPPKDKPASDLFRRLGPGLPPRVDPDRIDWDAPDSTPDPSDHFEPPKLPGEEQ